MKKFNVVAGLLLGVTVLFTACQNEDNDAQFQQNDDLEKSLAAEQVGFGDQFPIVKKVLYGTEIEMQDLGNGNFAIADMSFSQEYIDNSNSNIEKAVYDRRQGKWPNRLITYKYDAAMPQATKDKINNAAAIISSSTDLTVRYHKSTDTNGFIKINYSAGSCSAQVGYQNNASSGQFMNIGSTCSQGSTVHEFLHAAGAVHEQNHWNRDNSVIVYLDRIEANARFNYTKLSNVDGYEYKTAPDRGSIMMYGSTFFRTQAAINAGQSSMLWNDGTQIIPNRTAMSQDDINAVNAWY